MSEQPANGGIRITNREVYDGLLQVRDQVNRLENRMDTILSENVEMSKRVRKLEIRYHGVLGGLVTAIGLLVANVLGLGVGT